MLGAALVLLASGATAALATRHVDAVSRHVTIEPSLYQDQVLQVERKQRGKEKSHNRKQAESVVIWKTVILLEGSNKGRHDQECRLGFIRQT